MNTTLRNSIGKHLFSQVGYKFRIEKEYFPILNPVELEEKFTLGSDTGGQAANKTANAVFFKRETRKKEKVFWRLSRKCSEKTSLDDVCLLFLKS